MSQVTTQPACAMWRGGYAALPVFASPDESRWQGDVLSGVILCVTQDCPSSQTSYGSSRKGRRRRRGRGQELPAVTCQRAGLTPRSTEATEPGAFGEPLPPLAGVSEEDVLGKNPLLSMFPCCEGVEGVCQDLLQPRASGVGRPGQELAQVDWFPLNCGGLHSLIAPRQPQPPWAFHCGDQLSLPGEGWGLGWASGVTLASSVSEPPFHHR